jgi:hypothetical protein
VQFNPKAIQETLKEELLESLGVTAGRLDEVPKEIAALTPRPIRLRNLHKD